MPGPYHDFILLSRDDHDISDSRSFILNHNALKAHPDALEIADDIILYLNDTLRWISTVIPGRKRKTHQGLDLYGQTVIHTEGAPIAKAVFGGWADIFSQGPETLTLRGDWSWIEGELSETGQYETLQIERDRLVSDLRRLEDNASKVSKSKGRYFILHWGI